MNWIRFDCNRLARQQGIPHKTLGERSQFLQSSGFLVYMGTALVATMLLPLLLVTIPVVLGPVSSSSVSDTTVHVLHQVARAAAPPLFLLAAQVTMEQATSRPWFHDLPRIAVPLGFSIWRQCSLWKWVDTMWHMLVTADAATTTTSRTTVLLVAPATALAVFNFVFYSYNLFVFLMMRMTPFYLDPQQSPCPKVHWIGYVWPQVVEEEETGANQKTTPHTAISKSE